MDRRYITYEDNLQVTASLTISSGSYSIACGDILQLSFHLKPWGFSGEMAFVVSAYPSSDNLLSSFQAAKPIPISLSVVAGNQGSSQSSSEPLSLNGMVSEREFVEIAGNQQANTTVVHQNPVLYRKYWVRFEDCAQFYWKQHYFQNLYSKTTYETIINAQKPSSVKLAMNWTFLTESQTQIFVNSGASENRNPTANFYDWLIWLTDTNNGYWYYNYGTGEYNLSATLPASNTTTNLSTLYLRTIWIKPARPKLSTLNIFNATASGASTKTTTNQNAVSPLVTDYTTIQPIPANFTSYTTLETNRFQGDALEAEWDYLRTPGTIPSPWDTIQFQTTSNNLSSASALVNQTLRVTTVDFECEQILSGSETDNYGANNAGFSIKLGIGSCLSSSTVSLLPDYRVPVYPVQVEGTVYSTQGSSPTLTYSYATASGSTVNTYTVQIPVWNNVQVQVPYMPINMNGQFYFPPYRDAQVLLNLGLNTADIAAYLDWRSNAIPAMTTQGNVIVMGQSDTSCTTINHSYSNNQPALEINRIDGSDTETIKIGEGFIILQTAEVSSSGNESVLAEVNSIIQKQTGGSSSS